MNRGYITLPDTVMNVLIDLSRAPAGSVMVEGPAGLAWSIDRKQEVRPGPAPLVDGDTGVHRAYQVHDGMQVSTLFDRINNDMQAGRVQKEWIMDLPDLDDAAGAVLTAVKPRG